jgi:tetratricopeptide (TPR) repeat protein
MKKNISFCILAAFFLFGFPLWAQNITQDFGQANTAYREGAYSKAAELYKELIQREPRHGVLYFDLGNALFRNNQTGLAILAYERALQFRPRDQDIRYNLAHVRSLLEYRIQDKRNWYVKAAEKVLSYISQEEAFCLFLCTYLIFMLASIFVAQWKPGLPLGPLRKGMLTVLFLSSAIAGGKMVQGHWIRDAIVLKNEAEVRYGPSDTDRLAFRLGEGLKVYVVNHREEWSRIRIPNGETGWIRNDHIEEVRLR